MNLFKLFFGISIVILTAFVAGAATTTVDLTCVADTGIRWGSGGTARDNGFGDEVELLPQYSTSFPERNRKAYIKFELPEDFMTAVSAEFKITITKVQNINWNWPYEVVGLNDDVAGNDWQEIDGEYTGPVSGGLTWYNAPGNVVSEYNQWDATETAVLGGWNDMGATAGDTRGIATQELVDFLNTDTDKVVTIMFSRLKDASTWNKFATKENGSYAPPTLQLTYEPVPELKTALIEVDADADIREASPDYADAGRAEHQVRNDPNGESSAKLYMQFTLPRDFHTAVSASFNIVRTHVGVSGTTYSLYGITDPGWNTSWMPNVITWNNAPANDPNSGSGFLASETEWVGNFQAIGENPTNPEGQPGFEFKISSAELLSFLNNDTDREIQLMLSREGISTSSDLFAASEYAEKEPPPAYPGPLLEIKYYPPCGPKLESDLNWDCLTDMADLSILASEWLDNINQ